MNQALFDRKGWEGPIMSSNSSRSACTELFDNFQCLITAGWTAAVVLLGVDCTPVVTSWAIRDEHRNLEVLRRFESNVVVSEILV